MKVTTIHKHIIVILILDLQKGLKKKLTLPLVLVKCMMHMLSRCILINLIQPLIRYLYRLSSTPSSTDTRANFGQDWPGSVNLPRHSYSQGQHGQGQSDFHPTKSYPPQPQIYPEDAYIPKSYPPRLNPNTAYDNMTSEPNAKRNVNLSQPPPGFQPFIPLGERPPANRATMSTWGSRQAYQPDPFPWAPPGPADVAAIARSVAHRDSRGHGDIRDNSDNEDGGTHEERVAKARRGKEPKGGRRR